MLYIPHNNFIGLDISESHLRVVQVLQSGKKNIITSAHEVALAPEVVMDGVIQKPDTFIKTLKKAVTFAQGKKIRTNHVVCVLPEQKTFIKILKIPSEDDALVDAIEKEIPNNIPVIMEDVYYDWQFIEQDPKDNKTVMVGVAPKTIVNQYNDVLKKANYIPFVFEIEALSIIRALFGEQTIKGPKIIIDFGRARSSLIFFEKSIILFSISLPLSGNTITEIIAKKLSMDMKNAEKAKILCGFDDKKCRGSMKKILHNALDELTKKIEDAIDFYHEHFNRDGKIDEIILVGGGANFININSLLSEQLHIPVSIANPLAVAKKVSSRIKIPTDKLLSYTTAIGLALRKNIM